MNKIKQILNHLGLKIILGILLCGVIGIIFPNIQNIFIPRAYAEDTNTNQKKAGTSNQNNMEDLAKFLEQFISVLYMLMWPALAIAGASLDNSLVYGKVFHLTAPLWQFWNMMKNFANYALGFMFILSIFLYIFHADTSTGGGKFSPKTFIPKLLLGSIAIQASWFIMAALIDISTILVYAFGGLPLTILRDSNFDMPIMKFNAYMNMKEQSNGTSKPLNKYLYGEFCGDTYLSCEVTGGTLKKLDKDSKSVQTFYQITGINAKFNDKRCLYGATLINLENNTNKNIFTDKDIKARVFMQGDKTVLKFVSESDCTDKNKKYTLSSLITKSKSMTGPLYALFGSILNIGSLTFSVTGNGNMATISMEFIIKTIIGLALIIPLFALAIALIMRVGMLWLIIAASPLLALAAVFDFQKMTKLGSMDATKGNILSLIFLPVVTTFALSICIVVLTILSQLNTTSGDVSSNLYDTLGVKYEKGCIISTEIPSASSACVETSQNGFTLSPMMDIFAWLMINMMGIAMMWTILFASMKTSALTKGVVEGVQQMAEKTLSTVPVIPTPWGMTGVGAAKATLQRIQSIPESNIGIQAQELQNKFSGGKSGSASEISDIVKNLGSQEKKTRKEAEEAFLKKMVSVDSNAKTMQAAAASPQVISSLAQSGQLGQYSDIFSSSAGNPIDPKSTMKSLKDKSYKFGDGNSNAVGAEGNNYIGFQLSDGKITTSSVPKIDDISKASKEEIDNFFTFLNKYGGDKTNQEKLAENLGVKNFIGNKKLSDGKTYTIKFNDSEKKFTSTLQT